MTTGGVPLATIKQRLSAFAIDAFAVGSVFGVAYCVPGFPQVGSLGFLVSIWGLFFASQAVSTRSPNASIGRTILQIQVVSAQTGLPPTHFQAVTRAAFRTTIGIAIYSLTRVGQPDTVLLLPIAIEVGLMYLQALRQTTADLAAKTVVISSPPVQPHRAPAVPMFSRDDKEFGNPPKK